MHRHLPIARALAHHPRLVMRDEPSAGVDPELRYELWRYLATAPPRGHERPPTTHQREEAGALCERSAFVCQGSEAALVARLRRPAPR
jgi:ABC-2 type transport system ATP-binding protein